MPFSNWMPSFKKQNAQNRRPRRRNTGGQIGFQRLEIRNLLAGIFLNEANGDLYIFGDSADDVGSVEQVNASTIRANIAGVESQTFSTSAFSRIVFIGVGGDDVFSNNSTSPALLLGNAGNDRLTGGSGDDEINGGPGADIIDGRGGDDKIIANGGDDTVRGGSGNDSIFGTSGLNNIDGEDGDDVIFGGDDADTINGGNGADRIFGLGGDDVLDAGNGGTPGSQEDLERDLVMGLDGDDTITGGGGLNHFYGGNGNDVMTGGNGENVMFGQNGNDFLFGGAGFDYLAGNRGDDIIDSAGGADLVVYAGNQRDFTVTGETNRLTVTHVGEEGTDAVANAEQLLFSARPGASVVFAAAEPSARFTVTVRPIVVANNNGTNRATFFGTTEQAQNIRDEIDRIYLAADIDVKWLPARSWNNTTANVGTASNRPADDLFDVIDRGAAAGRGIKGDLILDLYFVNVAAGFDAPSDLEVNGRAINGGDGITIAVGSRLPTFDAGQKAVARLTAHEIGHNLGLDHVTGSSNLMIRNGSTTTLTAAQIADLRRSRFTV